MARLCSTTPMCRKLTWAEPSRASRSGPWRQGHSQMSRDERELQHVHPRRLHPLRHCFAGARRRPDDDQARRQGAAESLGLLKLLAAGRRLERPVALRAKDVCRGHYRDLRPPPAHVFACAHRICGRGRTSRQFDAAAFQAADHLASVDAARPFRLAQKDGPTASSATELSAFHQGPRSTMSSRRLAATDASSSRRRKARSSCSRGGSTSA
jgi:hypothetical protein